MSTVPQSLVLTVADFRNLGEGPPHYQLIEGEIQRFEFSRDPAKPVQIIDEAEMFASPLFPGLTIPAAEVFKP